MNKNQNQNQSGAFLFSEVLNVAKGHRTMSAFSKETGIDLNELFKLFHPEKVSLSIYQKTATVSKLIKIAGVAHNYVSFEELCFALKGIKFQGRILDFELNFEELINAVEKIESRTTDNKKRKYLKNHIESMKRFECRPTGYTLHVFSEMEDTSKEKRQELFEKLLSLAGYPTIKNSVSNFSELSVFKKDLFIKGLEILNLTEVFKEVKSNFFNLSLCKEFCLNLTKEFPFIFSEEKYKEGVEMLLDSCGMTVFADNYLISETFKDIKTKKEKSLSSETKKEKIKKGVSLILNEQNLKDVSLKTGLPTNILKKYIKGDLRPSSKTVERIIEATNSHLTVLEILKEIGSRDKKIYSVSLEREERYALFISNLIKCARNKGFSNNSDIYRKMGVSRATFESFLSLKNDSKVPSFKTMGKLALVINDKNFSFEKIFTEVRNYFGKESFKNLRFYKFLESQELEQSDSWES